MLIACGILEDNGLYLIAQRGRDDEHHPLRWEFPGGKVRDNESGEECIVRELKEELDIDVQVKEFYGEYKEEELTGLYYIVKLVSGVITLNEHEQVQWVHPDDLDQYDLLSVDRRISRKLASER